jgi:uncharacterized membrane protein
MDAVTLLEAFTTLDAVGAALLFVVWSAIGPVIEWRGAPRKSVSVLMTRYRREWMTHVATRDPRVFDAFLLGNLRDGTAFFASACLIAIGGGMALLANAERVRMIAEDLTLRTPSQIGLEVKILVVLLLITSAFLRFVWSNRVFGYCAVVLGTIPNAADDPRVEMRQRQAAELNVSAAQAFNGGLRSIYFALAALAWLLGPEALIGATLVALVVIVRREYASRSRAILMERLPPAPREPGDV